jgi:hypothetical protein
MDKDEVEAILAEVANLLEAGHEYSSALRVRDALSGSAQALEEFLKSNELWGGAGSIADQPFAGRSGQRQELERLLIQLGRIQLTNGNANIRSGTNLERNSYDLSATVHSSLLTRLTAPQFWKLLLVLPGHSHFR